MNVYYTRSPLATGGDKRIAVFQNALASQMDEFKRTNDNRAPSQMDIQAMVNKLLLPIVIKEPGMLWGTNDRDGFAFEAGMRPDGSSVDVVVEYSDIPIDLRRGIALDLERELGRKPSEDEVVQRYEDFSTNREPTPIVDAVPTPVEDSLGNRLLRPIAAIPAYGIMGVGKAIGFIDDQMHGVGNEAARDRNGALDRFLDGDPLTGGQK